MIGSLISAGASLAGGLLGQQTAKENREAQLAINQQNIELQKEFATHGITWKVDDARRAGIHPIYALGGSSAAFTPSAPAFSADTSLPNAMAQAGQDVGRAIDKTRSADGRSNARTQAAATLQLEGMSLDNDLKRAEIASKTARLRADQIGPPLPAAADNYLIPGQTESGLIKPKPMEVAPANPGKPHMEGGAITDVGMSRTNDGWAPVPSKDVKERIEDNIFQEALHFYRNNVLPSLGQNLSPPYEAPKGKQWWYNTLRQEYQLLPEGKRPFMGHQHRKP